MFQPLVSWVAITQRHLKARPISLTNVWEDHMKLMKKAGVSKVVSCNTIAHKTNGIDVTPLLTSWLKKN